MTEHTEPDAPTVEEVEDNPAIIAETVADEAQSAEEADPLAELDRAQFNNLGDAYKAHAAILDEQRDHMAALNAAVVTLRAAVDESTAKLAKTTEEFQKFAEAETNRIEEKTPPVDTTMHGKSFGGPGF